MFNALDHWSENRHVDVSTALVGTEHDSKKAEKVKAGFEEITGEGRAVDPELVWQYGRGEGGPRGVQAQGWRCRWHAAGVRAMLRFVALAPSSIFVDLT